MTCTVCNKSDDFSQKTGKCIFHCDKEDWYKVDPENPKNKDWSKSKGNIDRFWLAIREYFKENIGEKILSFKKFVFPSFQEIIFLDNGCLAEDTNFWYTTSQTFDGSKFSLRFYRMVDFSQAIFLSQANFVQVLFQGPVSFKESIFHDGLLLNDCKFKKTISFEKIQAKGYVELRGFFEERLTIKHSVFSDNFCFNESTFVEKADILMMDNTFGDGFLLQNSLFQDKFDSSLNKFHSFLSRHTDFYGDVFFHQDEFWGGGKNNENNPSTVFRSLEFYKKVKFSLCKFYQLTLFEHLNFSKDLWFLGPKFYDQVAFNHVEFSSTHKTLFQAPKRHESGSKPTEEVGKVFYPDPEKGEKEEKQKKDKKVHFNNIIFPEKTIFRWINLEDVSFQKSFIECLKFDECIFEQEDGRIVLYDEKELRKKVPQTAHNYEEVENIYRQFKKNFDNKKDFETAGDFYIGEMEMRREKFKKQIQSENSEGLFDTRIRLFLLSCFKLFSYYGERPSRILGWIVLAILCFAIVFDIYSTLPFWKSLGLSLKSFFPFLTVDHLPEDCYGQIKPIVSFSYNFERIISFVFWFLFALSVRQKFRR